MSCIEVEKILVIHGPNLNMLGRREEKHYSNQTLDEINKGLISQANAHQISIQIHQSNQESQIVDWIHQSTQDKTKFLIINPAAFGHTSIALRDALLCLNFPFIEVHISNIYSREEFRQFSYTMDLAYGVIMGLGPNGYSLALTHATNYVERKQ